VAFWLGDGLALGVAEADALGEAGAADGGALGATLGDAAADGEAAGELLVLVLLLPHASRVNAITTANRTAITFLIYYLQNSLYVTCFRNRT
jgi:hypothetical protein